MVYNCGEAIPIRVVSRMSMTLLFAGDAMLGRLVGEAIEKEGVDFPLGSIRNLLQSPDITILNLECAITDSEQRWQGAPKAFYFGAPLSAANILKTVGIDVVTLANNHILDFDRQGLLDTLTHLNSQDIQHVGAGLNLSEAKKPMRFEHDGVTFTMMAYCDHQADFSAGDDTPGMNYLDLSEPQNAIMQVEQDFNTLITQPVDWPILSLHWGPNMVLKPSKEFIDIAHAAINIGYKIIFGHSAHVFHGVEFYQGCPIIYAAGDLVDDYAIDPYFKNDHGLLFELEIDNEKVKKIKLHPIFLEFCQTIPANKKQRAFIEKRFTKQCNQLGTEVSRDENGNLMIGV